MSYKDPEKKKEYNKRYRETHKKEIKEYYQNHKEEPEYKEKRKEYDKKYREDNKEKRKEYDKKYKEDNKEELKEYGKKYKEDNKEKLKEYDKKYKETHKEEIKEARKKFEEDNPEYHKKYRQTHKKEIKEANRNYKENNIEKEKEYHKKYRETHKEEILKRGRNWRKNNPEKVKKADKKYNRQPQNKEKINLNQREKRKNPLYRLSMNISKGIYRTLKSNNLSKNRTHYEDLIINTFQEIKEHLEKNFLPGMTLENHGRGGWHIHHIIPIEFFKFTSADDVEFKYCWSTDNLTPLWEEDNIEKRDKITLWGKEYNARNLDKDYFSKITYEKNS